jgi:hypothetical protein
MSDLLGPHEPIYPIVPPPFDEPIREFFDAYDARVAKGPGEFPVARWNRIREMRPLLVWNAQIDPATFLATIEGFFRERGVTW